MSEKHLYEKHLAEKLQQVPPPPDMQTHWQEMKALLDEEMPRGGYFGRNGRWWRLGVIAGILLIGGWLTGTSIQSDDSDQRATVAQTPTVAPGKTGQSSGQAPARRSQQPAGDNGFGQPNAAMPEVRPATDNQQPVDASQASAGTDQTRRAAMDAPQGNVSAAMPAPGNRSSRRADQYSVIAGNATGDKTNKPYQSNGKNASAGSNPVNNTEHTQNKIHADGSTVHNTTNVNNNQAGFTPGNRDASLAYSPVKVHADLTEENPSPADHIQTNFSAFDLKVANTGKSRSSRANRSRAAGSFSIGFSLPLAFPLGDQKALGYNFSAGANTISDYIPAPHLQYHFNDKTYLQTEVQVMAPQFIRPILLYQHKTPQSGNAYIYQSIYAKKLYYFNLPVGIHYSPFSGFYLGTGLQFSSLLSGVALYEETRRTAGGQQTALLSERYARFGGDSLSHRMNPSEVRLLLEVNYYFNRFTVGLRYNQAFNNYVSFQIDPSSPYTFDKNKALQFYLRYNLWEDLKRKPQAKGLLSSK